MTREEDEEGGQEDREDEEEDEGGGQEDGEDEEDQEDGNAEGVSAGVSPGERPQLPGRLPGLSLADLTAPASTRKTFREARDMQPVLEKCISLAAEVVGSDIFVLDTHAASCRFSEPVNQPDLSGMAVSGPPAWPNLVYPAEAKLSSSATNIATARGQIHKTLPHSV